jgi:hypothetical protein
LDKMAVFYRDQEREAEALAAVEEATAVRELFLANALSREAGVQLAAGKNAEAAGLYERAIEAVRCQRRECEELRASVTALHRKLRPPTTQPRSRRSSGGVSSRAR